MWIFVLLNDKELSFHQLFSLHVSVKMDKW